MSVREKVLKVLAEDSCAEPEQLRDHTKLKELRMDSLDTLEFVMNLEEELEISVADDEITVEITRSSAETANVEVVARKSAVEYDKTRAKDVLDRIVSGK